MKIEIKDRTNRVLFGTETATGIIPALEQARAQGISLAHADLSCANLAGAKCASAKLACASLYAADLSGANLTSANLAGAKLACAKLVGAKLVGARLACANLAGADLSGADLSDADLTGCSLQAEQLEQLALNIPLVEDLDRRVWEAVSAEGGSLDMSRWHRSSPSEPVCGSMHCRAGWAIHLAGVVGYALEWVVGPAVAGALIYMKSTSRPAPDFYASTEEAMQDMLCCAACP